MFDQTNTTNSQTGFSFDLDEKIEIGKIKAHRNLNAPQRAVEWSITPLNGDIKGKVLGYTDWVLLDDVFFRVQPRGALRIKQSQVRSVVAWAEGMVLSWSLKRLRYTDNSYRLPEAGDAPDVTGWTRIVYDALCGDIHFKHAETGEFFTHAEKVLLTRTGACFAKNPTFKE
jgi:hypothetical protein